MLSVYIFIELAGCNTMRIRRLEALLEPLMEESCSLYPCDPIVNLKRGASIIVIEKGHQVRDFNERLSAAIDKLKIEVEINISVLRGERAIPLNFWDFIHQ